MWFSKVPDTSLAFSSGTLSSGRTLSQPGPLDTAWQYGGIRQGTSLHQWNHLQPSTSIHLSSSRNKGATDKPGLDHHPHNSAMDRILHNPQHGYNSCNDFWIWLSPSPKLGVQISQLVTILHFSSHPSPDLACINQGTELQIPHCSTNSTQNAATLNTGMAHHLGSPLVSVKLWPYWDSGTWLISLWNQVTLKTSPSAR
jgi:hypothetical protein